MSYIWVMAMLRNVVEEFKRFCRKLGGEPEVNEYAKSGVCVLGYEDFTEPAVYAHEFADFVRKWKGILDEEYWDLGIATKSKLIGGYEEYAGIWYDPAKREFELSANLYSEFIEEHGEVKEDAKNPRVSGSVNGVKYEGSGDVIWNDATWAWMGVGSVRALVRDLKSLSEEEIEEIMSTLVSEASNLAGLALGTMIEYAGEEEEW